MKQATDLEAIKYNYIINIIIANLSNSAYLTSSTNFLFLTTAASKDLIFTEGQVVVGLSDDHMSSYLSTAMDILGTLSIITYYSSINLSSIDSLSAAISSVSDTDHSNMVRSSEIYSPPVVAFFVVFGVGARFVSIMSGSVSICSSGRLTTPSLRSSFCWPFMREKSEAWHLPPTKQLTKQ